MMRRLTILLLVACTAALSAWPQRAALYKLSPMLRHLVRQETQQQPGRRLNSAAKGGEVCAFVRISGDGQRVLSDHGCRWLASAGSIHIASIPIDRLKALSLDGRVVRIEANRSCHTLMDSVGIQLSVNDVHDGRSPLPQAYDGTGVVVGVMDIGFDLTHPNFYDRTTSRYRIQQFWDMLSADTVGSSLYVGREYTGRDELLALGCARDGNDQTHGTHTLGTAAGSGYDSPYRGLAPESDICIVANATTDDIALIDTADYYKYTFATDALGFKYIFDYAERQGQPCVISFSEGSGEDFWGYDQLYYEMLDSLVGPGRILVAAAGNQGRVKSWLHKPAGQPSAGTFIATSGREMMTTLKSSKPFTLRYVSYNGTPDTLLISVSDVLQQPDSLLTMQHGPLTVIIEAYPSCYQSDETCYDITTRDTVNGSIGYNPRLSVEILGTEADVELYRVNGHLNDDPLNTALCDAECTHNIHSPGSAPSVICVGNSMYRQGVFNYKGTWKEYEKGGLGLRNTSSSVGPTYDGRTKPDVMAPGTNIISSLSSFYLEKHPDASDVDWDVEHFTFQGRTYAWNSNSGTSMSCPAVAGIIALWLQACPTLSPADVMGVLERTCRHTEPLLTYPNNEYGHGEIDAYKGLLDILGLSHIDGVAQQHTTATITIQDGLLHISLPEPATRPFTLRLHDLSGRQMLGTMLHSGTDSYTLPLPHLAAGVYAVSIGPSATAAGSTLIRIASTK